MLERPTTHEGGSGSQLGAMSNMKVGGIPNALSSAHHEGKPMIAQTFGFCEGRPCRRWVDRHQRIQCHSAVGRTGTSRSTSARPAKGLRLRPRGSARRLRASAAVFDSVGRWPTVMAKLRETTRTESACASSPCRQRPLSVRASWRAGTLSPQDDGGEESSAPQLDRQD